LPEKEHLNITHLDDIIRFEARSNYTLIVLKENREITTSKHLGAFEELLPRHVFIRAHNSHIVNVNYVAKYLRRKKYGMLELKDGTLIPISANRKKEVAERIIF
jgi:two-component system LytT family response regulator